MSTRRTVGQQAIAAVAVLLGMGGVAGAEPELFGLKLDGELELDGRVYIDRPSPQARAKLEEYRDLSEAPFGAFRFRLLKPDLSYGIQIEGEKIGQEDQRYNLSVGRLGLWEFDFQWDQIPHFISSDSRVLHTETSEGVFTLPAVRPPLQQYNAAPYRDLETRWDTATFNFLLTPTPDWDLRADYQLISKNGERPVSVAFGSPGGNFAEVFRPIDDTIHDFRVRASYMGEGWQVQGGYALSIYQNGLNSVTIDNPCFRLAQCANDANGPARAQLSLAPDNMAHTFDLGGGVSLPYRTRLTGNFAYSLRLQDDSFLSPDSAPQSSLDGSVQTILLNVRAVSRPIAPLTLTARYRFYDYDDQTDDVVFSPTFRSVRPSYTKHNADLDARWRFGAPLAMTVGGGWERWDRGPEREVETSDEYFAKLAADATPAEWMVARLTYTPSFRRIDGYNTFADLQQVSGDPDATSALGQSTLLRKFDEGERNRQRVDLMLQFTPLDTLTVAPVAGYRYDDYIDSPLGVENAEAWSAGLDVTWSPGPRFSASAGYLYESIDERQRSQNRDVSGGGVVQPDSFKWVSDNVDRVQTVYGGLRAALIPGRLDWTADVSYSHADGQINTRNPTTPTGGTAAQNANARAKPFPAFKDSLLRVGTSLRYVIGKGWSVTARYIFEQFDQTDFQTDGLNPFVPGITSIWLGNDPQDYTAHILTFAVNYRFD